MANTVAMGRREQWTDSRDIQEDLVIAWTKEKKSRSDTNFYYEPRGDSGPFTELEKAEGMDLREKMDSI